MSPPNSCLVTIQLKNLQLSEVQIHELLWSIQQKFVDLKIEVFDDRFLTPILKSLQRKGLLAMNLDNSINHRYIKDIHVSQPSKFTDALGKKRWWRFWS
ncbi:MAG: hypothetical protein PHE17_09910 [Thiothrix sp.]|nr:hypothetical protein [Thiothrix sp.]